MRIVVSTILAAVALAPSVGQASLRNSPLPLLNGRDLPPDE